MSTTICYSPDKALESPDSRAFPQNPRPNSHPSSHEIVQNVETADNPPFDVASLDVQMSLYYIWN